MRLVEQIAAMLKAPTTIEMFGTGSWRSAYTGNVQADVLRLKRIRQELLVETRTTLGKKKHHLSWGNHRRQSSIEHHICCNTELCNKGLRRGGSGLIVLLIIMIYHVVVEVWIS